MSESVREYYDANAEKEWNRLVSSPYHNLEYIITMHFIEKHLPKKGLILDAGGGPGRYTIELAKRGYDVVLQDLSLECLNIAEKEIEKAGITGKVKKIVKGSITNLSEFPNENFSGVLCLGVLTHLTQRRDREKAVSELVRVSKRNAPILISVVALYGLYRTVLKRFPKMLGRDEIFNKSTLTKWPFFADAYFFHPSELRELFESHGGYTIEMATCEGLSSHLKDETDKIFGDKEKWDRWLEVLLRTCNDPIMLGLGEHFLYIGRRR